MLVLPAATDASMRSGSDSNSSVMIPSTFRSCQQYADVFQRAIFEEMQIKINEVLRKFHKVGPPCLREHEGERIPFLSQSLIPPISLETSDLVATPICSCSHKGARMRCGEILGEPAAARVPREWRALLRQGLHPAHTEWWRGREGILRRSREEMGKGG